MDRIPDDALVVRGGQNRRPTIYADFNNADPNGSLRLNCIGTIEDLSRKGVRLSEGLRLTLHDEELEADGEVHFSPEERIWVAIINWQLVRQLRA
jgi:hypothetical protein